MLEEVSPYSPVWALQTLTGSGDCAKLDDRP